MRRIFTLSAVLAAVLSPAPAGAATVTMEAADFKFIPANATLNPGDTLLLKNTGKAPHNAVAKDGSFKSEDINAGQETTVQITKAGTFAFVCTFHEAMGMKGTLTVGAASEGSAPAAAPDAEAEKQSEAEKATESGGTQGEEADTKKTDEKETEPVADKPPVEKYFPYAAGALLLGLFPMMGMAYRKNMKAPAARRPEAPPPAEE